jgi:hypothetical protein
MHFSTRIILLISLFITSCKEIRKPVTYDLSKHASDDTADYGNGTNGQTTYTVVMVGDIMLGTNYPSANSLPPADGINILDNVKNVLQDADLTIGNLEGTLLNSGGTPKQCRTPGNCVLFRMPEHYAGYLKDAGFDILSLANNHSGDMGDIGRQSSMKTLDRYGIKYAGYLSCPDVIAKIKDKRFSFTAFAPNYGTQSLLNLDAAELKIRELKKKSDIVIVSFHGGAEGSGATRIRRETEYYLGENRGNVFDFSRRMIDAGADIVFGHGPHVPRAVEIYRNRIIAYSLGNFCTYAKFGLAGPLGYAPILKVTVNSEGEFINGKIISAEQRNGGIPFIDNNHKAARLISDLTRKDFPESRLIISENGDLIFPH